MEISSLNKHLTDTEKGQGFEIYDTGKAIGLVQWDKIRCVWDNDTFSLNELALALYATLVEPPLLYN